jgi:hypothetical protein
MRRQYITSIAYSFDSIIGVCHTLLVAWDVEYDEAFLAELEAIEQATGSSAVREEVAAMALLLRQFGPQLRRPHCDTLKGSKHPNMKELRFTLPDGEWRVAFAFDPRRRAILLVGGSKSGMPEKRFYRELIRVADARFDRHVKGLKRPKGD